MHVSHKTIPTQSHSLLLPFCWHKLQRGNMLFGLKITTTTTTKKSSHQLNNMSNVWVKIHCNGDGKQQHSFQHSQESCTLPGTQDGYGGLFWAHATGGISPSQEGFPISESQAWISADTHKLCLRGELFVSPHQLHLGVVSTIPRHSQGTTKPC